jgi:hypothetical protein
MAVILTSGCGSSSAAKTSPGSAVPPTAAGPNSPNYQQPPAIPNDVPPLGLPTDLELGLGLDCRHASTFRPADVRAFANQWCRISGVQGVGILANYSSVSGKSAFAVMGDMYAALSTHGWHFAGPDQYSGIATNGGWKADYTVQPGKPYEDNGKAASGLTGLDIKLIPHRP